MAEIVVMPKMGLTAREGRIESWLVEVGGQVGVGDALLEVETDKVTAEIESPASGVLLRRTDAGLVVAVGEPIAVIGEAEEDVSSIELISLDRQRSSPASGVVTGEPATGPERRDAVRGDPRMKVSPVARKRAAMLGVDLSTVQGSGPGGRITVSDVEDAAVGPRATVMPAAVEAGAPPDRRVEASRLRKAIAATVSLSAAVPQFSLERDVDVGGLSRSLAERFAAASPKPGLADAIGVATARAVRRHEEFLRQWDDGWFRYVEGVHLGIAVALGDGLVVPVIRDADRLSIDGFAAVRRQVQKDAIDGKLGSAAVAGAAFTISNLGPFGVDRFRALVNPPESGILALGRARDVMGRLTITLCLSADHRVVDGLQGARLLDAISLQLEDPAAWDEVFGAAPG